MSGTQAHRVLSQQTIPPVAEDPPLNPETSKKSKLSAAEGNLQIVSLCLKVSSEFCSRTRAQTFLFLSGCRIILLVFMHAAALAGGERVLDSSSSTRVCLCLHSRPPAWRYIWTSSLQICRFSHHKNDEC